MNKPSAKEQQPFSCPRGWYQDIYGQALLRFWDGVEWTDYTSHVLSAPPDNPLKDPRPQSSDLEIS